MAENDRSLKMIVIGAQASGRYSLLDRITSKQFVTKRKVSGKIDLIRTSVTANEETFTLHIWYWNTAKAPEYKMNSIFGRNSMAVLAIFDVTSRSSFDALPELITQARAITDPNVVFVLIGTKIDASDRAVSSEEACHFANEESMPYAETSSVTGEGVEEMLQTTVQSVLDRIESGTLTYPPTNVHRLNATPQTSSTSPCSC